ncbi:hypothetical protein OC842_003418 [Tilletia horrida]|uniref:Inositol polyphosphate-related phosphatase domain-containing protein n=1 Tax=Tilletia horrida TaxID=155126 RepID=A0AAN6GBS7_9BASI|nr:hypothetical protein OC842_003418 [Tilletia horrida]
MSAQDSTMDARLRAAAGIDNDAHAEEAEAQQQSVSALRSRFEHLQSSSSTPHRQQQPSSSIQSIDSSTAQPPPPLLRTSSTFSTVSRISLPDIGSALTWADGGSMKTPGPPSASSSAAAAAAAAAPMSPPAVPAESAAAPPPPLPPTLPPRPLSSGQVPQAAAAATPLSPPPAIPGVRPVSPSASASASASASQRPPSHPSSAAARSTSYTSSAQPSPSASPNPAGKSGSNGSLCAAVRTSPPPPPATASTFSPSGTRLPAASSSSAISSSEPATRAFPPPLLRSQHSKHNTGITTAANASLLPPPSQHQNHRREQAGMSPYSSSSATEDEDDDEEEGRDLFGASSDEDDEARYDHAPATPIPIDGATGPVSRHLSLARKPRGFRQKRRTLGAKALESVTATSTFLSRSLSTSARSPTNLAPLPPSIISLSPPGSASTSRPGSSGGTSGNDGGGSGVGLGLRGVASPMSSASSRFSAGIVEQFPDATHVNRRPPAFLPPRSAIAKSEFVDFDVCGSIVVTATHDGKVKVYHLPAAQANTAHSGQGISTSQHASHSSSSSTHHSHSSKYAGAEKVCEIEIRASKNGIEGAGPKEKLTAIAFRCAAPAPTHAAARKTMGRFVWVATKEGVLYEVDLSEARVCDSKMHLHSTAIVLLERVGDKMIALDDGGKISTWVAPAPAAPAAGDGEGSATPAPVPQVCVTMQTRPSTQRITLEKHACPLLLGDQLWICSGPHSSSHHLGGSSPSNGSGAGAGAGSPSNGGAGNGGSGSNGASAAGLRISIYNPPFVENRNFSAVSRPVSLPRGMASAADVGAVCTGATIPARPDVVFLGHESGHVTIWSKATFQCVGVQRLGRHSVVAMAGVVRFLWVGTRTGEICVYDPEDTQTSSPAPAAWRLLKKWGAHREPIFKLVVDRAAADVPQLQVGSAGEDGCVHFWDGTLQIDWLDKAVLCREAEFCTFRPLRLFITTFNIDAACPLDLQRGASSENVDFLETLITSATRGEHAADILVFGLQELIDLEKKSLTAKTLLVGKRRFADDMGAKISANYKDWHDALTRAVLIHAPPDRPYHVIASDSLVGLFTLVFVRASELPHIRDAATGVTKVGLGGRYGNKGAIATRMVIEDTSLSFVNCHLSAGQRAIKRRNQDVADILEDPDVFEQKVENTDAFVPGGDGRMILDHTLCFLSGDLNYRIDERRDTTIALIKSRQLDHLLALDQLRVQMRTNPTFRLRYFTEASPLSFDPTYKYDKHTHEWDSSAKQRIPAWCDRILWREQGADWSRSRARSRSTLKVSPTLPAGGDDDGGADASAAVSISSHLENVGGENGLQTHPHPPPLSTSPIQQHQLLHEAQTHPHPPGGAGHVRVLAYRRWEPTISDHRPVSGLFEIQVRRVVRERKEEVLRQLRSEWREVEEEMVGIANSQWWL